MNYTRYGLERKEDELIASSGRIEKRISVTIMRVFFFALLAALVIAVAGAVGVIHGILADAPDIDSINISPSGFATFIYDSEGNQLQKLTSSNSNRTAVSIDNVPVDLQHAVVAIEDERFYQHNGIDPKGIVRALVVGLKNRFRFTEGASTITQQLLKNNVFTTWTQEKTIIDRIRRKFQEQFLAVELEKKLNNKNLILENYLNTINLGAGTYGVEAAAKKYFGKDVWDLTLSECTVLAGITKNPSRYNPIRHPDENAIRRERILAKMVKQGYIQQSDMDEALTDDVYTRIAEAQEAAATEDTVYSYFVDELTEQVVSDLVNQKGYTENQAYQLLYSGGLRIYTTQDRALQKICDEEYTDPANFPEGTTYSLDWALSVRHADGTTDNYSREMLQAHFRETIPDFELRFASEEEGQTRIDEYKLAILKETDEIIGERTTFSAQPQSSLALMDQSTGYVKAIVGGRGKKTASLTLNRATGTYRQPGSTFKVLSTYAPALDSGAKTLASEIDDEPFQYSTGDEVRNSDGQHRGWITVRQAITDSVNVAAVKTLTEITPQVGYDQLLKFGITSLDASRDIVQPLALGGISKGVSNLELTAAFAAVANGGVYTKPVFYTKILDQYGSVIIDNTPETRRAVSEDTAWLLTNAMEDVVKKGTATAVQLDSDMAVAGKTGTTNDYRNVWFVGYTPYYTMGIWAGYDDNTPLPEDGIYREYHKLLWKKIMDRIAADQPPAVFAMPGDIQKTEICGISNMKPTGSCEFVHEEYVAGEYVPVQRCTLCGSGYEGFDYDSYEEPGNDQDGGTIYPGLDDTGDETVFDEDAAFFDQTDNWDDDDWDDEDDGEWDEWDDEDYFFPDFDGVYG